VLIYADMSPASTAADICDLLKVTSYKFRESDEARALDTSICLVHSLDSQKQ